MAITIRRGPGKTGAKKTAKMRVTAAPKFGAGVKGTVRKVRPRGKR